MAKKLSELPKDFKRIETRFKEAMHGTLAKVVRQEALNHFEASWGDQGFTDQALVEWKGRKEPARQFNKNGKRSKAFTVWQQQDTGRAILVGHRGRVSGLHLKDSLKGTIQGNNIIISSDKPYAQVHNEGGRSGRGKGFTMPKRQFMGHSSKLDEKVKKKFDRVMDKYFKQL